MELMHLVYASKATVDFSSEDIGRLLNIARRNNQQLGVTGILLFDHGSFIQILEGDESTVNKLFDKIGQDKRHGNVVKIISEAIAERSFGNWSMGFADVAKGELEKEEGMNDFFRDATCLADIDSGRAKKLLVAFAAGRWRLN